MTCLQTVCCVLAEKMKFGAEMAVEEEFWDESYSLTMTNDHICDHGWSFCMQTGGCIENGCMADMVWEEPFTCPAQIGDSGMACVEDRQCMYDAECGQDSSGSWKCCETSCGGHVCVEIELSKLPVSLSLLYDSELPLVHSWNSILQIRMSTRDCSSR